MKPTLYDTSKYSEPPNSELQCPLFRGFQINRIFRLFMKLDHE